MVSLVKAGLKFEFGDFLEMEPDELTQLVDEFNRQNN